MSLTYRYVVTGVEPTDCQGEGVADDMEAVCTAVTAAIRRAFKESRPEVVARVLTAYWGPLRHQLLTDGVSATRSAGHRWSSSAGPISVEVWCL